MMPAIRSRPARWPKSSRVEQVLIETYGLRKNGGTLLNRINSISRNNSVYQQSIQRGNRLLQPSRIPKISRYPERPQIGDIIEIPDPSKGSTCTQYTHQHPTQAASFVCSTSCLKAAPGRVFGTGQSTSALLDIFPCAGCDQSGHFQGGRA